MPKFKFDVSLDRLKDLSSEALKAGSSALEKIADKAVTVQEILKEKNELVKENQELKMLLSQINLRNTIVNSNQKLTVTQIALEDFLCKECGMSKQQLSDLALRIHIDNKLT